MSYTGVKGTREVTEYEQLDDFAESFVRMLYGAGFTHWKPRISIYESLQQIVGPAPYLNRFDSLIQKLLEEGALCKKRKAGKEVVRLHRKAADYLDPVRWDYIVADIRRNGYGGPLWETVTAVLPRARRPARGIWGVAESILLALSVPINAFIASAPIAALLLRSLISAGEYPGWLTAIFPEPARLPELLTGLDELAWQVLIVVWVVCALWFPLYHWLIPDHERDRCLEVHMPFWWHVKFPGVGLLVWAVAPAGVWVSAGVFVLGSLITIVAIEARRY